MAKKVSWIVIADGARARIFANTGPGTGLALVEEQTDPVARQPSRELGTDKPGRSFESGNISRHSMTPRVDWHDQEKSDFLGRLATQLGDAANQGTYDSLYVVAPPRALGVLRKALAGAAAQRLAGDLAKDLTNVSGHDLPAHLTEMVKL